MALKNLKWLYSNLVATDASYPYLQRKQLSCRDRDPQVKKVVKVVGAQWCSGYEGRGNECDMGKIVSIISQGPAQVGVD